MSDLAYQSNAADPDQGKAAERRVKSDTDRRRDLVRARLSTTPGRELYWLDLARHGIFEDCVGSHEAVYAFLGRRAEGLHMLMEATAEPDLYLLMHQEAMARMARVQADLRASKRKKEPDTT